MYQPLADLLRPQNLDEVFGQEHILGKGAVLRRLVDSGKVPNMIFYGPSGTGKTTVAQIIAKQTNRKLYQLNATTASTADIKNIVAELDTFMAPNGVLLYLDEIQSFNKKQQQSLLEHIENGKITLIASTTENPYFYVFNAILSRSTVFEFKTISAAAALQAVKRAVGFLEERTALRASAEEGALEYIAGACGGDLRKAMNAVEVLFSAGIQENNEIAITLEDAKMVTQKSALRADRDGDNF
ncbi:MAG: AAA family ATPase, partial [Oscillospiraceae bacterium]|nr:AAA family ATPase [Oscillospiraceae bacterium]